LSSLARLQELPPKTILLLVGPPGSGKSTFCQQTVLTHLLASRPVIFVTTEHAPSDVIHFLRKRDLGKIPSGIMNFVDAFHETVGLSTSGVPDTVGANCGDLTSIEVAISKLQNKIGKKNILLIFDSLTSPYLLNGQEVIKFLRLSLAKFAAEGNAILLCIDDGCGKQEDVGAMMSIVNGIIKMKVEDGTKVLNVVKHPVVKPTIIKVPMPGSTGVSVETVESLSSLNEKLDWIVRRLDHLEAVLTESQKYPEVVGFLRSLRIGTALYGEPLKTLDRLVSARRLIESTSQKDEISRIIINAISLKGPQNISQLTRQVQYQRGKASRTTIRKRVRKLLESKALIKEGNDYCLP
jgi:KaiC/GvpD/RAD55 family RecA-like ATPase